MKYKLGVGGIIVISLPAFLTEDGPVIKRSFDTIVKLDSKNVHLRKHMVHDRYRVMTGYINSKMFESEEWNADKVANDDRRILEKEMRKQKK